MADSQANGSTAAVADPPREVKTHKSLFEALLAAQEEMPAVEPDKENGGFKGSKYVSLGHLLSKVRPVLNRHGLVLVQAPRLKGDPAVFVLETTIKHAESDDSLVFDTPLSADKGTPQAQGSAITYMRRYTVAAALAIADQEDDDGNNASAPQATESPVARLRPERVESIIGAFRDERLSGKEISALLAAAAAPPLAIFTAEAISAHIGSLGEVEADALEAALDGRENRERLSDERLDQFMQGYAFATEALGGVTPLDGLNYLLGSLGIDALEADSRNPVREQVAYWPLEQVERIEAEFTAAVDRATEPEEADVPESETDGEGATDADA